MADCAYYTLTDKKYSILRNKPDRCDLIISTTNQGTNESKSITISLRNSMEEWLRSFSMCIGKLPTIKTISLSHKQEEQSPNLTLDLTKLEDTKNNHHSPPLSTEEETTKVSHEIDLELAKRLKTPPTLQCCFTETVHIHYPENQIWVKRLLKLDCGMIFIYDAVDHVIVLQGLIYLSGCSIIPLQSNQQPMEIENLEELDGIFLRIQQTREKTSILSKYSPDGCVLHDYFIGSFVDIQFPSPSILRASVDTIQRAIRLNVVPLETLLPLTSQLNEAIYSSDLNYSQTTTCNSSIKNTNLYFKNTNSRLSHHQNQINLLLQRYLKDIQFNSTFQKIITKKFSKEINLLYKPDFMVRI